MMWVIVLLSAPEQAPELAPGIDLNSLVSGGVGASVVAAILYVIKLILDRTIPSRSDARANVTLVLEGLNNMVKVLQAEKFADSDRLKDKQGRIDLLEEASDKDYARISELRAEVIELRTRLAVKDRHINTLVTELRKLGAQVTGLELEDFELLEVTHLAEEMNILRDPLADSNPA